MKKWLPAVVWRRGVVTMVVVVVVVAPKWNEQRKNEPGVLGTREVGWQGRGRNSTDGFHLPDRRGRREDQRKTVVVAAAVDPCSVSKPHGKNEREGDTGARGHSNHGLHLPDKRQHKRRKWARPNTCRQ